MIITGIICFLAGGVVEYMLHSKGKMTAREFEQEVSRVNGRETGELVAVLEWSVKP